eukprot:560644-Rhodomonas_salina.1
MYRKVPDRERLAGSIDFEIFLKYLGRVKDRKAAGLDRFQAEFLKYADRSFQEFVLHMVNLILERK